MCRGLRFSCDPDREVLHDSPVYIFDEAASNIDVESENDTMGQIHALAKSKSVILISHRLANVEGAGRLCATFATIFGGYAALSALEFDTPPGHGVGQHGDPGL